MKSLFERVKKITGNNNSFFLNEDSPYEVKEYIDTGCYALNAVLSDGDIYKGIPDGKRIMLAGESGTAKSLFTTYMIKKYLDNKPNSKAIFFESEGSTTVEMAKTIGIPEDKMIILPVMTIEETRTQMVRILDELISEKEEIDSKNEIIKDKYEKELKKAKKDKLLSTDSKYPKKLNYIEKENFIFILDSLGMLGSIKETEDVATGSNKKDMTKSQLLRGFARVISLKLSLSQSPFLVVNHTYQTYDKYNPEKISGGGGFRFMCDCILILSKRKAKEDGSKEQIGVEIRCKVDKSRYMKENKFVRLLLSFKKGLYKYSHLVEMGAELEIFKKDGFSYILPDGSKVKMKEMRKPSSAKEHFNEKVLDGLQKGIKKDFEFGDED